MCHTANPAMDSVKVDLAMLRIASAAAAEPELAEQREREQAEEEQRRRQEEAELARLEQQRQLAEQQQREQEQKRECERAEEEQRRRQEEAELARLQQQRQLEEKQRLAQEREHEERKQALQRFFTRHGFTGMNDPRKSGCAVWGATTTYPLHCAAELADVRTVEMLLKEGAKRLQKNSSGKTALQVAQKKNKAGSHDAVLRLLAGESSPVDA